MRRQLDKTYLLFDGFAHRNFAPTIDGWRNEMPDASGYSCVQVASDTLALYDDLCAAKRRIWELEQEVKMWKPIAQHAAFGINAKE